MFDQAKKFVVETLEVTDKGHIDFDDGTSQVIAFRGFHGGFFDTSTQTVSVINTPYVIGLNTTDLSFGISIVGGNRISFANKGVYNIQWSGQFENSNNADQDVQIWIRKNGSDIASTNSVASVPSKHGAVNGHTILAWNWVVSVNAGDYVQLAWSADSILVTMPTIAASGFAPLIPSIILTATQVR